MSAVSFNIMLVTYDILLKDVDVFVGIDWQIVIVDEGNELRIPRERNTRLCRASMQ